MLVLSLLSLFSASVSHASYAPPLEQTPLGGQNHDSEQVLRRYALQGQDIVDVVRATEVRIFSHTHEYTYEPVLQLVNARIWHASPSHVDVLFEHADQKLDIPLPEAGTIPLSRPEHLAFTYGNWDLSSLANTTYHAVYHPLYEIESFMEDLSSSNPSLVQLVNLGHSSEGREMMGMKISKESTLLSSGRSSSTKKAGFVITGAQHAREVGAPSARRMQVQSLIQM